MKTLLRLGIVFTVVALTLAGVAVWWIGGSEGGLQWAVERAQGATGGRLSVERPRGTLAGEVRFDRLSYRIDGVTIVASGVSADVGLGVDAVLARAVALRRLHIDRLQIRLSGSAPKTPDPRPSALPEDLSLPIGLSIEAATIDTLEIVRDGRPLDAIVSHDVSLSYAFGDGRHSLKALGASTPWGRLSGAGGLAASPPFATDLSLTLDHPGAAPPDLPARVQLSLGGNLRELQLDANAVSADMHAQASASLAPFAEPWPRMLRDLRVQAEAIDLSRFGSGLPTTKLSLDVRASRSNDGLLQGRLQARNAQAGSLDEQRIPVAGVSSGIRLSADVVGLDGLEIDLAPGGRLTGRARVQAGMPAAELDLQAEQLDLKALHATLRRTALDGSLRMAVEGAQRQSLSGTLQQPGLRMAADVRRDGDTVTLQELSLRVEGGLVTGSGRAELGAAPHFDADLRFAGFDPARLGDYPRGSINGTAHAAGSFGEADRMPRGQLRWTVADSRWRGQPLSSRGSARFAAGRVEHIDAWGAVGRNRVDVTGAVGGRDDRLRWRLEAPALAQLADGLGGQASGSGTLAGRRQDARMTVRLRGRELRLPGGLAAREWRLEGTAGLPPSSPLNLHLDARGVVAQGTKLEALKLDTDGTPARHVATIRVAGREGELDARLRGGWQQGRSGFGTWSGTLQSLALQASGPRDPNGAVDTVRLTEPAHLTVSRDSVVLRGAVLAFDRGAARIEQAAWQPGRLDSSGHFSNLPTSLVERFVSLPEGIASTLRLDGRWSIAAAPRLSGTLSISRRAGDLRLGTPPVDAGLARAELQAGFDDGRMQADLRVDGRLLRVEAQAAIAPVPGASGIGLTAASPIQLQARLDVDDLRPFTQPLQTTAQVSGQLQARLSAQGTLGEPRIEGSVDSSGLGIRLPAYGVDLRDGELQARIEGSRLRVRRFVIHGGDGQLIADGTLPLTRDAAGATLAWRAERLRMLNRPDMRLVVTGQGEAGYDEGKLALRGTLRADRGHFEAVGKKLPTLGPDVVVVGAAVRQAPEGTARAPLALDLRLDLGDDLSLRGMGLRGRLTGRLHVTTSEAGELRARGRVEASDATFVAFGQALDVDPGVLIFDGPIDNPVLQVTGWRRHQQVEAGVQVTGTARSPRVALISDPPLSEGEQLSWLVLGRAPGDAAGADIALLQTAAGAFMGRGGGSVPLTERIASSMGLDEFAIRGSHDLETQVAAFGKRLSDRLYVTYEQGLSAVAESVVRLDFVLTRRISLRAETGTKSAFGVQYRFAWD